jgi:hypothetical protein
MAVIGLFVGEGSGGDHPLPAVGGVFSVFVFVKPNCEQTLALGLFDDPGGDA